MMLPRQLLAAVVLYMTPSDVLCDQATTSDLKVMFIPEICVHKVKKILTNVASLCEGNVDPLMSDQQFESEQSEGCKAQLDVAQSLFDRFLQQLSQSRERIRGMSGIAIRYQGNRTSLNDLLNRNHQLLLGTVDEVVRDIDKWKMNTPKRGVSYRDSQDMENCLTNLKESQGNYTILLQDLNGCQQELEDMKYSNHSYETADLVATLNRTAEGLNICKQQTEKCKWELNRTKRRITTVLNINRNINNSLVGAEKKLAELETKLETCNKNLNVHIHSKEQFNIAISNLQKQIHNDTKHLQIRLKDIIIANKNTTLLNELGERSKALRTASEMLVKIKRAKTANLSTCEVAKSNLVTEKSNVENSLGKCENETKKLRENVDIHQSDLKTCNVTRKQQEVEINKTHSENTQLKQAIGNLTEIVQKCNESLLEQNRINMNQMQDIKYLENEGRLKEDRVKGLEDDKAKLNEDIKRLNDELKNLENKKEELLQELKIKGDKLETYEKGLQNMKYKHENYTSWCEKNLNELREKMEDQKEGFKTELKNCRVNNTNLMVEKNSLESQQQNCTKVNKELELKLMDEAKELSNCIGDKLNLTNTIVFKNRDLEDVQREYENMNLTSRLGNIRISTRIRELEIKLRYLEYLLKSNRNEIKMLQEYGVILIMLVNKNADLLSLLKETFLTEGEGLSPVVDDRFEALLRRLLRSVEDHHSRIYTQLLQMKPYMDKVVPIRVRRQVQRGRPPEVALLGAAKDNNMTEVGILLDVGANVNVQDGSGLTPLHWAAMLGHAEVAELLLCRGAEPNLPAQGRGVKTALHLAAEHGHSETVQILLDFGSNIEARAKDFATPLLYAAYRGMDHVVSILLQRGADIRSTNAYDKNIFELGAKFPKVIGVLQNYSTRGA